MVVEGSTCNDRGAMDAAVVGKRKYASARRTVRHCRRGELLGKVARPDTRSPASDCSFLRLLCLSFLTSTMQYVYPFRYEFNKWDSQGKLCPFLGACCSCTGHFSLLLYLTPSLLPTATNANANVTLSTEQSSNRKSILTDRLSSCLFVLTISV